MIRGPSYAHRMCDICPPPVSTTLTDERRQRRARGGALAPVRCHLASELRPGGGGACPAGSVRRGAASVRAQYGSLWAARRSRAVIAADGRAMRGTEYAGLIARLPASLASQYRTGAGLDM